MSARPCDVPRKVLSLPLERRAGRGEREKRVRIIFPLAVYVACIFSMGIITDIINYCKEKNHKEKESRVVCPSTFPLYPWDSQPLRHLAGLSMSPSLIPEMRLRPSVI